MHLSAPCSMIRVRPLGAVPCHHADQSKQRFPLHSCDLKPVARAKNVRQESEVACRVQDKEHEPGTLHPHAAAMEMVQAHAQQRNTPDWQTEDLVGGKYDHCC